MVPGPLLALVLAAALLSSCNRNDPAAEAEMRGAVQLLTDEQGELASRAADQLKPHGARALTYIETALHTAPPVGRRNLVMAMRRIGAAEAAPLMGHLAAYDEDAGVRLEARWTLKQWMAAGGLRGEAARAALRKADEVRGMEDSG